MSTTFPIPIPIPIPNAAPYLRVGLESELTLVTMRLNMEIEDMAELDLKNYQNRHSLKSKIGREMEVLVPLNQ